MTTTPDLPTLSEPSHLPASLDFLGAAPLLPREEVSGYDTLLARISGAVKPADILEEIWVRDVVDLVWDAAASLEPRQYAVLDLSVRRAHLDTIERTLAG